MDDEIVSFAEKFLDNFSPDTIHTIEGEGDLLPRLDIQNKSDFEKGYLFAIVLNELKQKFGQQRVELSSKDDLARLEKILGKIRLFTFD